MRGWYLADLVPRCADRNVGDGCLGNAKGCCERPLRFASRQSLSETMRGRVLAFVRSRGDIGATREDIEIALEMRGSTVRPRVVELLRFGTVKELEATRATSSGRQATVLVAT